MILWSSSISSDPISGLQFGNPDPESPVVDEKADGSMKYSLRAWKCRHCGFSNSTEVGLDGAAACTTCGNHTQVQPSRIRNGVVLPASYPTRRPTPRHP